MRTIAALVLAAGALAALPVPAQDFSKYEVTSTQLAPNLWMLQGAGGNLALSAGEDAAFLVDDQYAPMTGKIVAAIAKLTPLPVRFVLNTHWHGDHTGGNENFGKAGALIVAHENVRKRMSTDQFIALMRSTVKAHPKAALPVVTFDGTASFHLNGEEIRAAHLPRAHTDGDSIVHFLKADVVHMGDIYFNGMYPFIDASSGGTVQGVIAACDKVLAIASEATRIIPGHGPISTRAQLQDYRDMLSTVAERIRKLVADGRGPEEIAAAGVTAEYDAHWGKGFMKPDRFVAMMAAMLGTAR
jgi:cyclase